MIDFHKLNQNQSQSEKNANSLGIMNQVGWWSDIWTHDETRKILPLVFGLLSHKTKNCYWIFLETLRWHSVKYLNTIFKTGIIITDLEHTYPKCLLWYILIK